MCSNLLPAKPHFFFFPRPVNDKCKMNCGGKVNKGFPDLVKSSVLSIYVGTKKESTPCLTGDCFSTQCLESGKYREIKYK